ncbi:MAG: hypothetical protein FD173_2223 [Gallionellaceae bacterium]|nr:MAG: hypothetical protein FD173_2223 [Gallionellaceae bacterium]
MLNIIRVLLGLLMFGFLIPTFALDGETIVFNPTTGNYLITYLKTRDGKFHQVTFVPATKINPTIKSQFKQVREGGIHYGYTLLSAGNSQQVIRMYILDPVSSVATSLPDVPLNAPPGKIMLDMINVANYFDTPPLWSASMGYSDGQMSFRTGWSYNSDTGGLVPGGNAVFGFKSRDLPGIIESEVYGYAPDSQEISGEEIDDEDGGFGQQYMELVDKKNFVGRNAAVPTIAVPAPFDAAVLLDRIRTQVATWPGKQLLDPALASQLDRYLVSAADAYRRNQLKAGKEHIETLREMLKREHKDLDHDDDENEKGRSDDRRAGSQRILIDRLAARVLDFDLKYVLKRMDRD